MMKHTARIWKNPDKSLGETQRRRLIEWRKERVVTRIERPTRLGRAKAFGYKAKQGIAVVRVRVNKGKRKRPKFVGGRVPKKSGRFFSLAKSKKVRAEERASRKFPNMEVLNSYYVGEDGQHEWYECVLADRDNPSIKSDRSLKWVASGKHKGRAFRAKTSSGKGSNRIKIIK
jgi:large subunit ribosomal protein L15e